MANRVLQLKRSASLYDTRTMAINNAPRDLVNGEVVIASYRDNNAVNSVADILIVKAQNTLFYIDNQDILNKMGVGRDGSLSFDSADLSGITSLAAAIDKLDEIIEANKDEIDNIEQAVGLAEDGTYIAPTEGVASGATSVADAIDKVSDEILEIEDFIGMGEGATRRVNR